MYETLNAKIADLQAAQTAQQTRTTLAISALQATIASLQGNATPDTSAEEAQIQAVIDALNAEQPDAQPAATAG